MRLIDADTLKEEFAKHEDSKGYLQADWEVLIDNAPIVEEKLIEHNTCLYKVDHIFLDQANYNLYTLFLHCKLCGKPIKLCVETENDIVKWLGGVDNG